jgi:ribonuclease HI
MITPQEIKTSKKGIFPKEIWESNQKMKIFTDGSKITNEEGKEIAAYAMYNSTTKKEELGRINRKQDNFRAELTAIMRAI